MFVSDDNNDRKSQRVLNELENIDDECDQHGIVFVKIDDPDEAKEYGIDKVPALMYFEKGIPMIYQGRQPRQQHGRSFLGLQSAGR